MFLWVNYVASMIVVSISSMTIGLLYTNACYLQSLHIILIEYAIFVESMSTDLKTLSVLQKCVSVCVCVFRASLCAFPCISEQFILHLLLNLITCLNNQLLLSVCLPNRLLIVKMWTSVVVFVF